MVLSGIEELLEGLKIVKVYVKTAYSIASGDGCYDHYDYEEQKCIEEECREEVKRFPDEVQEILEALMRFVDEHTYDVFEAVEKIDREQEALHYMASKYCEKLIEETARDTND